MAAPKEQEVTKPITTIIGTGSAVPEQVLTNFDLEKMVDTSDEWIIERTGIRERRIGDSTTTASSLATVAAEKALQMARMKASDLDLILVATVTPDMPFPSVSCLVQKNLGALNAIPFDLAAGCTGFIYGLATADAFVRARFSRNVLLVGVEILSKITDWTDRNTCVLFGDGAGAVILTADSTDSVNNSSRGLLGSYLAGDGRLGNLLMMPGGGSLYPATHESIDQRLHYLKMSGNDVFKLAVTAMGEAATTVLEKTGVRPEAIDLLVPHQANLRIITATAKRLKLPMEKVYVNIDRYGNTSSASIPIAMDEIRRSNLYREDMLLLLVAFGAGFTWGATLVRW